MHHLLLKAVTTATDQGTFEAVISAASVDREKDIVSPDGMVRALKRWEATGKSIPLAWNHSTAAEDIIGHVDPSSAKALGGEVVVTGWIDQGTPRGAEAWRLVKSGTLGFSFGYLIPDGGAVKRAGGGLNIQELDVFEITATPTPMNNDTRVLSFKSVDELRREADRIEREVAESAFPVVPDVTVERKTDRVAELARALEAQSSVVREISERLETADRAPEPKSLRRRATRIEREREQERLPDAPDVPAKPDLHDVVTDLAKAVAAQNEAVRAIGERLEAAERAPDPEALRKQASRVEREREAERLPNVPETKQAPVGGILRVLNSMIGEAQEFIDADPDPEDQQVMQDILETLQDLLDEETAEGDKSVRLYARTIAPVEMAGVKSGHLKAVWSAAYVNSLPDSAFLYVAPGGSKDAEGKTVPRSLRSFPVKDADGNVDMPHLQNAMARIPQSDLPQSVKDRVAGMAQRMMDAQKSVDVTGKEPAGARSVDPLRKQADAQALEFASGGESLRKPPKTKQAPAPQPELTIQQLKVRARHEMLAALSGIEEP